VPAKAVTYSDGMIGGHVQITQAATQKEVASLSFGIEVVVSKGTAAEFDPFEAKFGSKKGALHPLQWQDVNGLHLGMKRSHCWPQQSKPKMKEEITSAVWMNIYRNLMSLPGAGTFCGVYLLRGAHLLASLEE
jgi:hypothetical protein